jgi:hypothetical protein
MWDLWWTKWHGGSFSPSTSVSLVNHHYTKFSTLIISQGRYMRPTGGRRDEWIQLDSTPHYSNKKKKIKLKKPVGLRNGDVMCFLWGTKYICIYYLEEMHSLQRVSRLKRWFGKWVEKRKDRSRCELLTESWKKRIGLKWFGRNVRWTKWFYGFHFTANSFWLICCLVWLWKGRFIEATTLLLYFYC